MTDRYDVQKARYELKRCVLDLVSYDYQDTTGWSDETVHQDYLQDGVALAARDLVNAINELNYDSEKPIGWDDNE